jgi:transposase
VFRAFVEHALVPRLRPGQVVVMDNLAAHKVAGVRRRSRRWAAGSSTCRRTRRTGTRSRTRSRR